MTLTAAAMTPSERNVPFSSIGASLSGIWPPLSQADRRFDLAVRSARAVLGQHRRLPLGWDGRHGLPTNVRALDSAVNILVGLWTAVERKEAFGECLLPQVFPLPDGALQFEWLADGLGLEVEVEVDGSSVISVTGPEREGLDVELPANWPGLLPQAAVSALADITRCVIDLRGVNG